MTRILFVCVENSCRSQIAEGFARHYGEGRVEAFSAGSRPGKAVNPRAVEVMGEVGIDLSAAASKGFSAVPSADVDFVVTMGCGDVCPVVPARERLDWEIPDPKGKPIEFFRGVRDEIGAKTKALLDRIAAAGEKGRPGGT